MAKLKSQKFEHTGPTGETFAFTSDISVGRDGIFSLSLPRDPLEQSAFRPSLCAAPGVQLKYSATKVFVLTADLRTGEQYIAAVLRDYLNAEAVTEIVISYGADTKYAVVRADDGTLYPNGMPPLDGHKMGEDARWIGNLHATQTAPTYRLGLAARVYARTTYTRPSGTKVTYKGHLTRPEFELGHWGEYLNRFCGLAMRDLEGKPVQGTTLKDMPYTEEAAEFFAKSLLSICEMAHRLNEFVQDEGAVVRAIQNRVSVLALPAPP